MEPRPRLKRLKANPSIEGIFASRWKLPLASNANVRYPIMANFPA